MRDQTETLDASAPHRYTTIFAPTESGGYVGRLLIERELIEVCASSLSEARWKLEYAARDHLTICLLRDKALPEPEGTTSGLQGGNRRLLQPLPMHRLIIDFLDVVITDR